VSYDDKWVSYNDKRVCYDDKWVSYDDKWVSYDDKWVSVMERPKACGEHPIRFYARDSGLLKFQIYAGVFGKSPPPSARRLVAFTFHPADPFAISVRRTNAEFVVNFHIRHV